jgi:hypothetical protein
VTPPASYEDIVTAVTVGLNQRPLTLAPLAGPAAAHVAVLDTADPAAAVLDAAALLTAGRRAGMLTGSAAAVPAAAAADTAPELSPVASSVLTFALGGDAALLADLLTAAAAAGFRAAPPLLPELLDAATRDRSLRAAVAAVLGERGRWLAAHRADWQRVAGASWPGADSMIVSDDPAVWQTGSRGARRSWLAGLRHRDPAAARDLLAAGWPGEAGDVREELLGVLAAGLSGADEPFLEAALDDRTSSVREVAAGLLAAIPSSAFNARGVGRAAGALRVERRALRRSLLVILPGSYDAAALRDGISPAPPSAAVGVRAWLLTQFIAAVPVGEWTARFGLDAASLVEMPVQGGLRADVHAGWRLAAARQGDAPWAAALLAADRGAIPGRPPAAWPTPAQLAAVLPADARVARAVALLAERSPSHEAAAEVADCPGPWPGSLADAVLAHVALAGRDGAPHPWSALIVRAAAGQLPTGGQRDFAAELRALASAGPDAGSWTAGLRRAADTIDRRRLFLKELR